ncbi:MAG TPA: protein kinase [Candidatus Krumholzibacteria bacterium]
MNMSPGSKLGPYEILSPLGAGGMGEVYRARDTRLGRDVAIKVLPQHLSSNSEVRARFEREAKTVSSLNHPHICTLFDVGREGGTDYLVMELIEGETLAARIAKGPLPVADVLKIGAQIADALDRAHRAGVVHRDLKPGNIMLTKSGAKLMDFGLARATGLGGPGSTSGAAMTQSPTIAQPLTAEGTIVGTFQYMAPEQLEGKETDARADIWALGCVLYETTTGRRAFEGATQASLISAIMRDHPRAMSELSPMSPPSLERLVRQCLAKDPDERWQTAGDVRRELEWIAGSSSQSAAPAVAGRRRLSRGMAGILAGVLIAAAAIGYSFGPGRNRPADVRLARFSLAAPEGTTLARPAEAALSPDGGTIAFVATDSSSIDHIYLRSLASLDARIVPGTDNATLPFWSPDGRMLAFFSDGKLRKVALDGSTPVVLCDAPDARGGTWSRSGVILLVPNNQGGIMRVSANGGTPAAVTQPDSARGERGHRYPQFLPDGKHFLYVVIGQGDDVVTYAASIDGGTPVEVCRAGSMARWAPPGYLIHLDGGVNAPQRRLLARRFDANALRTTGDPELVIDDVKTTNFGYPNAVADEHGTLVVQHWNQAHARLTWKDRRGANLGTALDDVVMTGGALSPDGKRLAYGIAGEADLNVLDMESGVSTRLTFENKTVTSVRWSPDGQRVAFSRLSTDRGWQIYTKNADGTGPDSLLFRAPGILNYVQDWSQDGRWIVALCAGRDSNFDLWRIPVGGGGQAEVYQKTTAQEGGASLSPDAKWMVYRADEGGKTSLFVQSFPRPGTKYQVTIKDPAGVAWSHSGDELLVATTDNQVMSVQVSTANGFRQGATTRLFAVVPPDFLVDIAPGFQRFLMGRVTDLSSLSRLEIVLGWPQLLEQRK